MIMIIGIKIDINIGENLQSIQLHLKLLSVKKEMDLKVEIFLTLLNYLSVNEVKEIQYNHAFEARKSSIRRLRELLRVKIVAIKE